MAVPATRDEFIEYVLRKLGKPVIEINVDDDQISDRVDEALRYYWDYHFDGTDKIYLKHQITDTDKTNGYIDIPENIIGVVNLFPFGNFGIRSDDMFSIQYQIALNDLYTLTSVSMVPYYMVMQNLSLIQELLVGRKPLRYQRHKNRCYIDTKWSTMRTGDYLVLEAYEIVDPDDYTDVWGDRWLQNYAAVLIQEQWGRNLTKFTGMSLPGGVQFNGQQILQDAREERMKMEEEMINSYSIPAQDMIG